MAKTMQPFHEMVAAKLIAQLEQGCAPWQKPWEPGQPGAKLPMNPVTGKRYRGINAIHLMSQSHTDPRWMTHCQAASIGAQVDQGEKGTPIQYWTFSEERVRTDALGEPVLDAQGRPVREVVQLERPRVFLAVVFHASQIDGLPPLQPRAEPAWPSLDQPERILQASGATIRHAAHSGAYYWPAADTIHLPDKGQFPSAAHYYATALHELGHWTGHASRLNRDLAHPFGSEGYAREELRAEIASMILGDALGIGHESEGRLLRRHGDMAEFAQVLDLVISERYATAACVSQALCFATVTAFDAGKRGRVRMSCRPDFQKSR